MQTISIACRHGALPVLLWVKTNSSARVPNGQYSAAPPTSVMKSRRLIAAPASGPGIVATSLCAQEEISQENLSAHRHQQRRLIHALLLRLAGPQWRVNAVQVGRVDLYFAVGVLKGGIFPVWIARRMAVLLRPTAAAAVARLYMASRLPVPNGRQSVAALVNKRCPARPIAGPKRAAANPES